MAVFVSRNESSDRLLVYGEVTPYDTFVEAVQDDMLESSPTGDVLQRIVDRIGDVLGLESTVMFVEKEPLGQRVVVSSGTRADEVVRDIYPRLESKIRFGDTDDIVDLRWRADSLLAVNLRSYGSRIGMLLLGPKIGGEVFVDDEKQLVSGIAPLVSLAVDQSTLSAELRDLYQRLVTAQEAERHRLAIDLHDGPLQKAFLLTRRVEGLVEDPSATAQELVAELREITSRLRPSILDDLGLVAGVEWLLEWAPGQTEVATRLQLDGVDETERFEPDVELTLFRVTQEAINNVLKHAKATHLSASLSRADGGLVLHVEDDGVGLPANGQRKKGLGLSGMRERVVQLYGTFEIGSAPKGGTRVTATVPLQNPVAVEEAR